MRDLLEFAREAFALSACANELGEAIDEPLREHVEALAAQGDVEATYRLDNAPPLPRLAAYIWDYFQDIAYRDRSYTGMGEPLPFSSRTILDWQERTGRKLLPWEQEAVFSLDNAWFAARPKPKKK